MSAMGYGFWPPQVQELEPGDVIMEIQPTVGEQA